MSGGRAPYPLLKDLRRDRQGTLQNEVGWLEKLGESTFHGSGKKKNNIIVSSRTKVIQRMRTARKQRQWKYADEKDRETLHQEVENAKNEYRTVFKKKVSMQKKIAKVKRELKRKDKMAQAVLGHIIRSSGDPSGRMEKLLLTKKLQVSLYSEESKASKALDKEKRLLAEARAAVWRGTQKTGSRSLKDCRKDFKRLHRFVRDNLACTPDGAKIVEAGLVVQRQEMDRRAQELQLERAQAIFTKEKLLADVERQQDTEEAKLRKKMLRKEIEMRREIERVRASIQAELRFKGGSRTALLKEFCNLKAESIHLRRSHEQSRIASDEKLSALKKDKKLKERLSASKRDRARRMLKAIADLGGVLDGKLLSPSGITPTATKSEKQSTARPKVPKILSNSDKREIRRLNDEITVLESRRNALKLAFDLHAFEQQVNHMEKTRAERERRREEEQKRKEAEKKALEEKLKREEEERKRLRIEEEERKAAEQKRKKNERARLKHEKRMKRIEAAKKKAELERKARAEAKAKAEAEERARLEAEIAAVEAKKKKEEARAKAEEAKKKEEARAKAEEAKKKEEARAKAEEAKKEEEARAKAEEAKQKEEVKANAEKAKQKEAARAKAEEAKQKEEAKAKAEEETREREEARARATAKAAAEQKLKDEADTKNAKAAKYQPKEETEVTAGVVAADVAQNDDDDAANKNQQQPGVVTKVDDDEPDANTKKAAIAKAEAVANAKGGSGTKGKAEAADAKQGKEDIESSLMTNQAKAGHVLEREQTNSPEKHDNGLQAEDNTKDQDKIKLDRDQENGKVNVDAKESLTNNEVTDATVDATAVAAEKKHTVKPVSDTGKDMKQNPTDGTKEEIDATLNDTKSNVETKGEKLTDFAAPKELSVETEEKGIVNIQEEKQRLEKKVGGEVAAGDNVASGADSSSAGKNTERERKEAKMQQQQQQQQQGNFEGGSSKIESASALAAKTTQQNNLETVSGTVNVQGKDDDDDNGIVSKESAATLGGVETKSIRRVKVDEKKTQLEEEKQKETRALKQLEKRLAEIESIRLKTMQYTAFSLGRLPSEISRAERRRDSNGQHYTLNEFFEFYGGVDQWIVAGPAEKRLEMRLADDGHMYSLEEFVQHDTVQGVELWHEAADRRSSEFTSAASSETAAAESSMNKEKEADEVARARRSRIQVEEALKKAIKDKETVNGEAKEKMAQLGAEAKAVKTKIDATATANKEGKDAVTAQMSGVQTETLTTETEGKPEAAAAVKAQANDEEKARAKIDVEANTKSGAEAAAHKAEASQKKAEDQAEIIRIKKEEEAKAMGKLSSELSREEKRKDQDGNLYSLEEFYQFYGQVRQWIAAGPPEMQLEMRFAEDGHSYTVEEFIEHYGTVEAIEKWHLAADRHPSEFTSAISVVSNTISVIRPTATDELHSIDEGGEEEGDENIAAEASQDDDEQNKKLEQKGHSSSPRLKKTASHGTEGKNASKQGDAEAVPTRLKIEVEAKRKGMMPSELSRKEKRMDGDNNMYTLFDFIKFYGSAKPWIEAGPLDRRMELRIGEDGHKYSLPEFIEHYGFLGVEKWHEAADRRACDFSSPSPTSFGSMNSNVARKASFNDFNTRQEIDTDAVADGESKPEEMANEDARDDRKTDMIKVSMETRKEQENDDPFQKKASTVDHAKFDALNGQDRLIRVGDKAEGIHMPGDETAPAKRERPVVSLNTIRCIVRLQIRFKKKLQQARERIKAGVLQGKKEQEDDLATRLKAGKKRTISLNTIRCIVRLQIRFKKKLQQARERIKARVLQGKKEQEDDLATRLKAGKKTGGKIK